MRFISGHRCVCSSSEGHYSGTTAYFNELFNYSTISKGWTKLDAAAGVTGTGPSARWFHAMTTVDQDIFVFGGATNSDGGEFSILAVLGLRKVGSAVLAGDHPSKWEQVVVALAGRSVILYISKGE